MLLQVTEFTSLDSKFLGIDSFAWRIIIANIFGLLFIAFVGVILWGIFKWAVRSYRKGWGNVSHVIAFLLLLVSSSSCQREEELPIPKETQTPSGPVLTFANQAALDRFMQLWDHEDFGPAFEKLLIDALPEDQRNEMRKRFENARTIVGPPPSGPGQPIRPLPQNIYPVSISGEVTAPFGSPIPGGIPTGPTYGKFVYIDTVTPWANAELGFAFNNGVISDVTFMMSGLAFPVSGRVAGWEGSYANGVYTITVKTAIDVGVKVMSQDVINFLTYYIEYHLQYNPSAGRTKGMRTKSTSPPTSTPAPPTGALNTFSGSTSINYNPTKSTIPGTDIPSGTGLSVPIPTGSGTPPSPANWSTFFIYVYDYGFTPKPPTGGVVHPPAPPIGPLVPARPV
jgi:hypothetical protein